MQVVYHKTEGVEYAPDSKDRVIATYKVRRVSLTRRETELLDHMSEPRSFEQLSNFATNMGLVERCILPLVITEVDGEAVEDAGRYEFVAGSKSFSGYAQGDFAACGTIADAGLGADNPIGSGSTTVNVPEGKAYYLGLDVRKADPKTWKVVTWRIDH